MTALGRLVAAAAAVFLATFLAGCTGDSRDTATAPQPAAPSLQPPSTADSPEPTAEIKPPAPQPAEDTAAQAPSTQSGPGGLTDEQLSSFLRKTLDLPEETRFTVARLRIRNGAERIVFFAARPDMMARRGVIRVTDGLPQVLSFEDDPCYCFDVQAEAVELVGGRDEFVVTRFSPLTGSCVGLEVVRILALGEDGALVEVWRGTTFEASGTESRIASVEFADLDGDGDLEILRSGKLIDCGEECLCREGPVIETFETVYDWNADSGRFQEVR